MVAPSYNYPHGIDIIANHWDHNSLDAAAPLADAVAFDPPSGRVMHLNDDYEFEPGAAGLQVPFYVLNNNNAFDYQAPDEVNSQGNQNALGFGASGKLAGICSLGNVELDTTEFDSERDYAPNDFLTAPTGNSSGAAATAGVVTNQNAVPYTNPICGIVHRGVRPRGRLQVLNLWTYFLPVPE